MRILPLGRSRVRRVLGVATSDPCHGRRCAAIVRPSSVMNRRRVRETLARKITGHAAMTRLMAIVDRGVTMDRTATRRTRRVTLTTGTTTDTNESRNTELKIGPAQCRPGVFSDEHGRLFTKLTTLSRERWTSDYLSRRAPGFLAR